MSLLRVPSTYSAVDVVLLEAVTNLHVGVGRAGGVVDLPVQRDELGFPCIYSSSLKGALKTALLYAFTKKLMESGKGSYEDARKAVMAILGPEPELGESFESSVAILDAYLLAMPVRSLKGVYAYVTTPTLLKRFKERLDLYKKLVSGSEESSVTSLSDIVKNILDKAEELSMDEALCIGNRSEITLRGIKELESKVVLVEEVVLSVKSASLGGEGSANEELAQVLLEKLSLDKPLLVLHDDIARSVIDRGLLRLTRVKLKRGTKTVEAGPWTEEYVPVKTKFHTLFLYKRPPLSESFVKKVTGKDNVDDETYLEALSKLRLLEVEKGKNIKTAEDVAESIRGALQDLIKSCLKGFIIVGGNETIGKGIVKLKILNSSKVKSQ